MASNDKPRTAPPSEIGRRVISMRGQPKPTQTLTEAAGKRLVVGKEIMLTGEITSCDTLVVEGTVEASLNDSRRIEITEDGYFKGNVEIDVAEIRGRFEGELTARERLIVRRTGRVVGTVRYGELEIERGGRIAGTVETIGYGDEPADESDPGV
ncbi:MAG: polymer-forming cytoskeletal protein [Alphaproteobacteria bacterium]